MAHRDKSAYYKALKAAGVDFMGIHYREWTTEQLMEMYRHLPQEVQEAHPINFEEPPVAAIPQEMPFQVTGALNTTQALGPDDIPFSDEPLDIYAGVRQNDGIDQPIRRDSAGRLWFQEEIRKKGHAAPRARRKLSYIDNGYQTVTHRLADGTTESVEIAGREQVASEVKITLPSYQVGIYLDRRFPFKVHTYNNEECFDLFEVEQYFGGAELMPGTIRRKYVENVLGYEIPSVVRAIEDMAREMKLI